MKNIHKQKQVLGITKASPHEIVKVEQIAHELVKYTIQPKQLYTRH